MAEAWGKAPWEIVNAPGSLLWAARWSVYQQEKVEAQQDAAKAKTKGKPR